MSYPSEELQDVVIGKVDFAEPERLDAAVLQIELALDGPEDQGERTALMEALLLSAREPVDAETLARGAGLTVGVTESVLSEIVARSGGGWTLQQHGDEWQIVTAPRFAGAVRRFLGLEREVRLSTAALEALAVIAYQQPVTRSDIESVRGVDCTGVLSTLLSRGLIEQSSRVDLPGQPHEYAVTSKFLQHFGLRSLAEMPDLGTGVTQVSLAHLGEVIAESRANLLAGESSDWAAPEAV